MAIQSDGNIKSDPSGLALGSASALAPSVNSIGTPGNAGFGVGIAPDQAMPPGMVPLYGYTELTHFNFGNYQYKDGSVMCWIPKFWYKVGTQRSATITGITQANPAVVTAAGHGFSNGQTITINNMVGMTQVNDLAFTVANVTANTFELQGVNSSGYTAYSSAGAATVGNGINLNVVDVAGIKRFANTAAANNAGYALHRAFIDGGVEKDGFFVDKYSASKNAWGTGFIASSIPGGLPLSTASTHNPIGALTAVSGINAYYAAITAAKARSGVDGAVDTASPFFCCSRFIYSALALISLAHGQASANGQFCAWFDATKNFPKGCNNNALKDESDATVTYISDGYQNCGKTGSGGPFAKTTHNGQASGVADLNGNIYGVSIGITCIAASKTITGATQASPCVITIAGHGYSTGQLVMITSVGGMTQINDKMYTVTVIDANTFSLDGVNSSGYTVFTTGGSCTTGAFYIAKQSVKMRDFTAGNTLATDHWGATGVAAMMDAINIPLPALSGGSSLSQRFGNAANQVLSESTSGAGWLLAGLGIPKDVNGISTSGTNQFGTDYYYQYLRNELCARSGGSWSGSSSPGVWSLYLSDDRPYSSNSVGFRSACYPV